MNKILGMGLQKLFDRAVVLNKKNIKGLLEEDRFSRFLDLGCDDGVFTMDIAKVLGTRSIFGVDIVDSSIEKSRRKGVVVSKFDLNERFDFKNNSFDVIHANQVIEHITNSDSFLSEIYRTLKPGGYAVISTENTSSWCNVFSSIMGWQIFSLTNFSAKRPGIGNPFSLHHFPAPHLQSWNHVRIYSIRGLKEYLEEFGFEVEKILGAGYFPFPAILGKLDKIHSHFITFKVRK